MTEASSDEEPGQVRPPLGRRHTVSAGTRLIVVVVLGVLAGGIASVFVDWRTASLIGWIVAAGTFLLWTGTSIWPMDAPDTARLATLEDPSRPVTDLVLLTAAVGSLVTVAFVIFHAQEAGPGRTVLGVASVIASWAVVHSVFMLKYARLYYAGPVGGIDFKMAADPAYRDFAYVAFIVGMTYQVADTDVQDSSIRSTVLRHALISFMFGTVIIAITINLIAGLSH